MVLNTASIFLGVFVVTSYQSTVKQTDNTPHRTSINEQTNNFGVAVHPSLLCKKAKTTLKNNKFRLCKRDLKGCQKDKIHYYDLLFIEDIGFKYVNDVMANKTKMGSKFDIWVESKDKESAHHKKFGTKKLKVWIIKGNYKHEKK